MASSQKVLIVEDERLIAEYFKIVVEHIGYEVCGIAGSADEAVDIAQEQHPDVVLMDVRLSGDKDGVYAAEEIFRRRPLPIIYITASKERATMLRISEDHPVEILIKPVVQAQLREALARHAPLAS